MHITNELFNEIVKFWAISCPQTILAFLGVMFILVGPFIIIGLVYGDFFKKLQKTWRLVNDYGGNERL